MKVRERLSKIFCLRIPLDPHGMSGDVPVKQRGCADKSPLCLSPAEGSALCRLNYDRESRSSSVIPVTFRMRDLLQFSAIIFR
ncbi:MAG TPA: hypothetical protein DEO40_01790, partial [Treponema sp.]|nr:hypothetical protein [Treponema sp.]